MAFACGCWASYSSLDRGDSAEKSEQEKQRGVVSERLKQARATVARPRLKKKTNSKTQAKSAQRKATWVFPIFRKDKPSFLRGFQGNHWENYFSSPDSQTEWLHWFSRMNQVSFDTVSFQTSSFPKSVTTVIEFLQPKWTAWNLLTSSSGEKKKLPIFNMRGYMRTPDYRMPWSSFYRLSYHMK